MALLRTEPRRRQKWSSLFCASGLPPLCIYSGDCGEWQPCGKPVPVPKVGAPVHRFPLNHPFERNCTKGLFAG